MTISTCQFLKILLPKTMTKLNNNLATEWPPVKTGQVLTLHLKTSKNKFHKKINSMTVTVAVLWNECFRNNFVLIIVFTKDWVRTKEICPYISTFSGNLANIQNGGLRKWWVCVISQPNGTGRIVCIWRKSLNTPWTWSMFSRTWGNCSTTRR